MTMRWSYLGAIGPGDALDWGAWAIKVNGPELMSVLADCFGDLSDRD